MRRSEKRKVTPKKQRESFKSLSRMVNWTMKVSHGQAGLSSVLRLKITMARLLWSLSSTSWLCSASLQFADPYLIIATDSFRFHSGLCLKAQEYPSCREIAIWEACVYTKLRNFGCRRCSPIKFSPCTLRCHSFANISKYLIQRRR